MAVVEIEVAVAGVGIAEAADAAREVAAIVVLVVAAEIAETGNR